MKKFILLQITTSFNHQNLSFIQSDENKDKKTKMGGLRNI